MRRSAWWFFVAVSLVYIAMSPLSISGMGYASESGGAAGALASGFTHALHLQFAVPPFVWPRHGLLESAIEVPFVLAARLFDRSAQTTDRALSLEPMLATAWMCTIVFVWARRLSGSAAWGFSLGVATAFTTMAWPYAYIGLETTQSLFVLLTAFLAFGDDAPATWPRVLGLAACASVAISVKANSIYLVPAVGFALLTFAARARASHNERVLALAAKATCAVAIIGGVYLVNSHFRARSSDYGVGFWTAFKHIAVDSPSTFVLNFVATALSLNKGLFVYAPLTVAAIAGTRRAWGHARHVTAFSMLTLFGLAAGSSLVFFWADETWGPRYLHAAVAPLIVLLAASRRGVPLRWRTEWPLAILAAAGLFVSGLGSLFYYGNLHVVAMTASEATLEGLQSDPAWNPVRFDFELAELWLEPRAEPVLWPPSRHRWFPAPGESGIKPPDKPVDIRPFASPQPYLLRNGPWSDPVRLCCSSFLVIGLLMLVTAAGGLSRQRAVTTT